MEEQSRSCPRKAETAAAALKQGQVLSMALSDGQVFF
jgi:hypothetical protein